MTRKMKNKINFQGLFKIFIVVCVVIMAAFILAYKNQPEAEVTTAESPAELLTSATHNKQPVLAFFHSNTCDSCLHMVAIVDQVFPEFADSVTLVDVNVYDRQNQPLLNEVGLQYIPTLYFYDASGQPQIHIGVMEASQLRQTLNDLARGE
ncbi:MAG: thioredoxin domain-containing protein [Anaerolineales bacterium]